MKLASELFTGVKTLTFDCYGTLIDWRAGIIQSLSTLFGSKASGRLGELFDAYVEEEAAEEAGPFRAYRDVLISTAMRLSVRFNWPLSSSEAQKLPDMLPTWKPFADTNPALVRLKSKFRLVVLSNIDRDLFASTARQFGVTFDFVITAQDVRAYKPNLAHFRRALETQGAPGTLLHVGQSLYHDGAAAMQLGIPFVWINRYGQTADLRITTLATFSDLKSFVDAVTTS